MPHVTDEELRELHTAMYADSAGHDASDIDCADSDVQAEMLPEWYDDWLHHQSRSWTALTVAIIPAVLGAVVFPPLLIIAGLCLLYASYQFTQAGEHHPSP